MDEIRRILNVERGTTSSSPVGIGDDAHAKNHLHIQGNKGQDSGSSQTTLISLGRCLGKTCKVLLKLCSISTQMKKKLWKNFNIVKKPDIPTFLIAKPAMRFRKRASGVPRTAWQNGWPYSKDRQVFVPYLDLWIDMKVRARWMSCIFSIHQDEGRKPPKIIISFRLKMCIVGKLQVAFFQDRKLARYHKSQVEICKWTICKIFLVNWTLANGYLGVFYLANLLSWKFRDLQM